MTAASLHNLPAPRRTGPIGAGGLLLVRALIPASGAALALVVVLRLANGALPLSYALWVSVSGAVGALAGLSLAWGDLGRPGARGRLRALRGGIVFSFAAAIVAGSLALPVFGTMFAPVAVITTLLANPAAAVGLVATLVVADRSARRRRALS